MNKGVLTAASAYVLWGLLPVFWKALQHVPAFEILAHRIVWALLVVLGLLLIQRHWRWLPTVVRDRRIMLTFVTTAILITINWGVYIWAVNMGYIVDASLGYFINPLINVALGALFLKERLRLWQAIAIVVALSGVAYLTFSYGVVPWIALTLAGSFAVYGLLRKTASLNSLEGLTLETMILFVPALLYLMVQEWNGRGVLGQVGAATMLLLAVSGIVTALPLLLFAAGARQITLTLLGILQYIAPTLQFLLGVVVYGEVFDRTRFIGFALIWLALALYTIEGVLRTRRVVRLESATGNT